MSDNECPECFVPMWGDECDNCGHSIYEEADNEVEAVPQIKPRRSDMEKTAKPKLKLSKGDGNAYSIIGRARRVAGQAGWSPEKIEEFIDDAMSGDYDHVLQACFKY